MLLARMSLLEDGRPADHRPLTNEENNREVRELIGANKTDSGSPEPALTTQFPLVYWRPVSPSCLQAILPLQSAYSLLITWSRIGEAPWMLEPAQIRAARAILGWRQGGPIKSLGCWDGHDSAH
jgi:hypothetical protein